MSPKKHTSPSTVILLRGNRPSFIEAARPEQAKAFYDEFNEKLRKENIKVETGIFGTMMEVALVNDGPVTIIIDSKNRENYYECN